MRTCEKIMRIHNKKTKFYAIILSVIKIQHMTFVCRSYFVINVIISHDGAGREWLCAEIFEVGGL